MIAYCPTLLQKVTLGLISYFLTVPRCSLHSTVQGPGNNSASSSCLPTGKATSNPKKEVQSFASMALFGLLLFFLALSISFPPPVQADLDSSAVLDLFVEACGDASFDTEKYKKFRDADLRACLASVELDVQTARGAACGAAKSTPVDLGIPGRGGQSGGNLTLLIVDSVLSQPLLARFLAYADEEKNWILDSAADRSKYVGSKAALPPAYPAAFYLCIGSAFEANFLESFKDLSLHGNFGLLHMEGKALTMASIVPHIDSVDDDFASVHYLSPHHEDSGTSLFKSAAFDSPFILDSLQDLLDAAASGSSPFETAVGLDLRSPFGLGRKTDALTRFADDSSTYPLIHRIAGRMNRAAIYPQNALHSAFAADGVYSDRMTRNVRTGRLTANLFLQRNRAGPPEEEDCAASRAGDDAGAFSAQCVRRQLAHVLHRAADALPLGAASRSAGQLIEKEEIAQFEDLLAYGRDQAALLPEDDVTDPAVIAQCHGIEAASDGRVCHRNEDKARVLAELGHFSSAVMDFQVDAVTASNAESPAWESALADVIQSGVIIRNLFSKASELLPHGSNKAIALAEGAELAAASTANLGRLAPGIEGRSDLPLVLERSKSIAAEASRQAWVFVDESMAKATSIVDEIRQFGTCRPRVAAATATDETTQSCLSWGDDQAAGERSLPSTFLVDAVDVSVQLKRAQADLNRGLAHNSWFSSSVVEPSVDPKQAGTDALDILRDAHSKAYNMCKSLQNGATTRPDERQECETASRAVHQKVKETVGVYSRYAAAGGQI